MSNLDSTSMDLDTTLFDGYGIACAKLYGIRAQVDATEATS